MVPVRGFRSADLSDSVLVTVLNRVPYFALIFGYTDTIRDLLSDEKIRFENSQFDILGRTQMGKTQIGIRQREHKTYTKNHILHQHLGWRPGFSR